MKKICVVTATRAEFGLLRPVMQIIREDVDFELQIVATGMHLSPEFGLTYKEIENEGFIIDEKIEIQMSSDSPTGIAKTMGLAMISFAECLDRIRPDLLLLLGDRYETFAIAAAATVLKIPIAHLYGGETTEGAFDEAFRHAITKMSYLHFTSTEEYRKRVVQLGEEPRRVFNVGAIGVENIGTMQLLSQAELEDQIKFKFNSKTALVTFHPVTLEDNTAEMQFQNLLEALDEIVDLHIIFTKANADTGGRIVNQMIDQYVSVNPNKAIAFTSMGQLRYFSALQFVDIVVGNSSSGIVEVPSFHKPTVNIGDRQKGRIQALSVINSVSCKTCIAKAINEGLQDTFRERIEGFTNPYEGQCPSAEIIKTITNFFNQGIINLKKKFYDIIF